MSPNAATVRRTGVSIGVSLLAASLVLNGCQRAFDVTNELPFGAVDSPIAGTHLAAQFACGGWALDDKGIREIRFYLDRRFFARSELTTARPDVAGKYAQFARGSQTHGWSLVLVVPAGITPGRHELLVQAVDTGGATRDLGVVPVVTR